MENEKIVLTYKKVETNEIHYEGMEKFKGSLYENIYREAYSQVENILNCNACGDERAESGNLYRKRKQINNIVSFIGGRGTGKTSAMLSFMESLKDYYYQNTDIFYELKVNDKFSKVSFVGIEHIDASLLENGEDLFEVILSMMYGKLKSLENSHFLEMENLDYQKREVFRKFERVYEGIQNLKSRKSKGYMRNEYESYVSSLDSLSVSMGLKDQFEELVRSYLNIIRFRKEASLPSNQWTVHGEPYLVITIDDVDMNIESGFEMLEQIHRYLMVKQVIVLLAVDDVQIRKICERHYWNIYSNSFKESSIKDWETYIHTLAGSYMDKVLPVYRRVYMPRLLDMKKIVKIGVEDKEEKEFVKTHILRQIAEKTMVCFSASGMKQHFYEPATIRGVINLCQFLIQLDSPDYNKDSFMEVFEKNIAQISADIYKRMVNEQLMDALWREFKDMRECEIFRRGSFAYERLLKKVEEYSTGGAAHDIEVMKSYPYSYGELLRCMYLIGRCQPEYKSLVRCYLASFSVVFTKQYILYTQSSKTEKRAEARSCLKAFLGNSVMGSWTNDLLPRIRQGRLTGDNIRVFPLGATSKVRLSALPEYTFPETWNEIKTAEKLLEKIENNEIDFEWIRELELILMLFSMYRDGYGNKIDIPLYVRKADADSMGDESPFFAGQSWGIKMKGRAEFNLLGFVRTLFLWDEYFERVDCAIKEMLVEAFCGQDTEDRIRKQLKEKLAEKIAENSLAEVPEYKLWRTSYQGFALPFYGIDMTYNVLKRAVRAYDHAGTHVAEKNYIIEEVQKMYDRIAAELKSEAAVYKNLSNKLVLDVEEAFIRSPFIVEFGKQCKQERIKKYLCEIFYDVAKQNRENAVNETNEIVSVSDAGGAD